MANIRKYNNYNDLIDDFFKTGFPTLNDARNTSFKVDIEDCDDKYVVSAELAGFNKNEIHISFDKGNLKITAEKNEESEEKERNYIHKERKVESMSRNMYFDNVDDGHMTAKFENGILYIDVPKKKEEDISRKIEIQ